jgi:hypothetical protein
VNNRDENVEPQKIAATTGAVRIVIAKPCTKSTVYFFTLEGFERFVFGSSGLSDARTISVASDFKEFATETIQFRPWEGPVADITSHRSDEDIDARRVIFDPTTTVPQHVGPILVRGQIPVASPVGDTWARHALRTLPVLLVDEIRAADDAGRLLTIVLPRTNIEQIFTETVDRELLRIESEAARWIYTSSASMETRHAFFAAELGRMWHDSEAWDIGFRRVGARALESAKSAERFMASGKTSDVLKAEGDLRKALNDEVSRVNQQIRDLTSALWRDFAVVIAALVARVSLARDGAADGFGTMVLVGAAVFLIASISVIVYANRRLLGIARKARGTWQSDVYAFLTEPEVTTLALQPICEAEAVYSRVETIVIIAYVVAILAMLGIVSGVNNGGLRGANPSPTPQGTINAVIAPIHGHPRSFPNVTRMPHYHPPDSH